MNQQNAAEEVLEKGTSLVKGGVKSLSKQGTATAKTVASQVGLSSTKDLSKESKDNPETRDFVKDLYASSSKDNSNLSKSDIKTEDSAKLAQVRQKLHGEYYQKLTTPKAQEERPTEKVEREEKEELQKDFVEKQKKPKPLAISRLRERVEKFPGASG
jgi:hypothetical protein